jgi:hypothetical protein
MGQQNRRTFIKGLAGTVALAGAGVAAGHPRDGRHANDDGSHNIHQHRSTRRTELRGFHTLGGFGSESTGGESEEPFHGPLSETWIEGDYVFVSYLSSREPTGNRGIAIVDASDYLRADSKAELDEAEMSLIATIGNETEAGTAADVKVSDDGNYLFYSKQALGATYGEPASTATEQQDAVGPSPTGIEAYDISDPGEPEYLGSAQGPHAGFHNCFTHCIGGDHYVFGVQGVVPGTAGVFIYRLDEATGGMEPVNVWTGGDARQGEYDTDAATFYGHDFYMQRDPKNGRPVGYWSEWNNGVRVLDFSDPTDIDELGVGFVSGGDEYPGEGGAAHYGQPAPATIGGKRVFIGSQELASQTGGPSGFVQLFDADGIFDDDEVTECERLASWTLYDNISFSGFTMGPHNSDITRDGWITQSHYHAGVQYLKIQPPEESTTDEWRIAGRRVRGGPDALVSDDPDGDDNAIEDSEVVEKGVYYSDHVEVPEESKGLARVAPNFWSARESNGITFAAGINTGLYALTADPIEVGTRTVADVDVTETNDGAVFTPGGTDQIDYEFDTDSAVRVRTRIPSGWKVVGGAPTTTTDVGDGKRVQFTRPVTPGKGNAGAADSTRRLFVEVPEGASTGTYTVGPVEYSADGGETWEPIPGSTSDRTVVGLPF